MKQRQRQQNQTSLLCDSLLYQPTKRQNEEYENPSKREEEPRRYTKSCLSSQTQIKSQEEICIQSNQKSSKLLSSVEQTEIDTDAYLHQSGNNELLLQTITASSQQSITPNGSSQIMRGSNILTNQVELQKPYKQLLQDFNNLGIQLQKHKNYGYNLGQQNFLLKRRISCLENQIICKNEEIDYLQDQLNRYEQMIATLHQKREREIIKVIKEVPVYIEKQILIEVPIPIYINQKQQPKTYQISINNALFQEQNSFAINQLSIQMQKSQVNSDTKKSNFKFGANCKSFKNMDLQESEQIKQPHQQRNCGEMRQRRVKQIVQIPVYIEKEIIKEVEKEVVREVIIEKEVIVEKQVIKYIQIIKVEPNQQKEEGKMDEEMIIPKAKKVNMKRSSLMQNKQIVLINGRKSQQQPSKNKSAFDHPRQFLPSASQCLLRIDQQSFQSNASNNYNKRAKKIQFSFDSRDQEQSMCSREQIILQIPVEIQKIIYCDRQVLLPLEIPTEIIIQKEIIKEQVFCYYIPPIIIDKIIEVQKIIEKQVIVQKIIEKIIPLQIIVQNKIPSSAHVTSAHKALSIDHKNPSQISIELQMLKDYRINKILVLQEQEEEHLRIDNFIIEEFVRAETNVRNGLRQILQIPVEIYLNEKNQKCQFADIHSQTNENPKNIISPLRQRNPSNSLNKSFQIDQSIQIDIISPLAKERLVQKYIDPSSNDNRELNESQEEDRKIQIFVQKVVYVYDHQSKKEAQNKNIKNLDQFSFVTFNESPPKQNYLQPQKPVSYQIIIQKIIQIEKPIEIIKEVERITILEVPVQILVLKEVEKIAEKVKTGQAETQTNQEYIYLQNNIQNQIFHHQGNGPTTQRYTQAINLSEFYLQNPNKNDEVQSLQIQQIASYADSFPHNLTERSHESSQQQMRLVDTYDYSHFSPEGLREKDDSQLMKVQEQNQRYQQLLERLNDQLKCTQDNMLELGRKNDQLYRQIYCLEQAKRNVESSLQTYKESINIKIERERNQLISIIQQQSKKREQIEGHYSTIEKTLTKKEEQVLFERNNVAFLDIKVKKMQKQKQTEILQLVKQIQQRNQHINDLIEGNKSINEELLFYKEKESRLIEEKSNIQEQLIDLRNNFSQLRNAEAVQKIELEQKISQMFKRDLHAECEDKIRYLEQFYKKEIEEISNKNTFIMNEKMGYIYQLQASIKQRQQNSKSTKNIQRNNQKINVKIFNMQNKCERTFKNQDNFEHNKTEQLYNQNQRFLQIIQQLNHQISSLNDQVNQLQQQLSKTYSSKQHSRADLLCYSQYKQPNFKRNTRQSSIRVEQLSQTHFYHQMQEQYEDVIDVKNSEIDKLKLLLIKYQQVIDNLQQQVQYNQISHYQNASIHQIVQPSLEHDRCQYFSNLMKRISLLEHKLRFQKIEKVKCCIQLRQCERIIQQYSNNQTQDHQKDIQLLEQLTYQYQQQKMKGEYLQRKCEKLERDNMYLTNQIMKSNDSQNTLKKSKFRVLMDDLEHIEARIEKDFSEQQSTVRQYQIYRIKYFKVMELMHLIQESVDGLQKCIPKSCGEHLNCIKRYLAIIENNQKNSRGNNSSSRKAGKISRVTIQQYNQLSKEEEDELLLDLKKLDLNNSPVKPATESRVILKNSKQSTIQFHLLPQTQIPIEIKKSLSLKLIELGMNLVTDGSLQYLNPEKILITHYDLSDLTAMKLEKRLTFRNKKGPFQSPEVLKGQKQSSISYSWAIGLLIDFIFHSSPFYSSTEQITSPKIEDDYYFRNVEFPEIAKIVQQMVVKKKQNRASLETAFSKMLLVSS